MSKPMSIPQMRVMHHHLCLTHTNVLVLVEQLRQFQVLYIEAMAKAAAIAHDDCRANETWYEDEEKIEQLYTLVGTKLPLFSHEVLAAVTGESVLASNIVHEIEQMAELAAKHSLPASQPAVSVTDPSFDGWMISEIDVVKRSYQKKINVANHHLRDINTNWKYLTGHGRPLPSFVKSSVLGLFGQADQNLGDFAYTEDDFNYKPYAKRLRIMTARWWAPFLGHESATSLERILAMIGELSKPNEGQPATLDSFGSDRSNYVDLFANDAVKDA